MSSLLYYTTIVIENEGSLILEGLPLKEGQRVEIVVYEIEEVEEDREDPFLLRSEPFYDEDPYEPVAVDDWDVLQ